MRKAIYTVIGGKMKTLAEWAREADISLDLIYKRYRQGIREYALIAPENDRLVTRADIRQLWGKWKYVKNEPKQKTEKKWSGNRRWVYVGKQD